MEEQEMNAKQKSLFEADYQRIVAIIRFHAAHIAGRYAKVVDYNEMFAELEDYGSYCAVVEMGNFDATRSDSPASFMWYRMKSRLPRHAKAYYERKTLEGTALIEQDGVMDQYLEDWKDDLVCDPWKHSPDMVLECAERQAAFQAFVNEHKMSVEALLRPKDSARMTGAERKRRQRLREKLVPLVKRFSNTGELSISRGANG